MKNKYLIILGFIVFIFGCEKDKEPQITPTNPPKSITIVSGNNQMGYPIEYLSDSIVLEIIPDNIDDLNKYSYCFKSKDNYTSVYAHDTILDNKMFVYVKWKLSAGDESKELIFFLNEKCDRDQCNKIDSVSIFATFVSPWKEIFYDNSWTGNQFYDIHFSNEKEGIAVGDLGFHEGYIKTLDGGITWSSVENRIKGLFQLSFADPDTGIVIASSNYALFTNNGGQSFYEGEWTPPIIGHRSSSDYFMFNSKEIITVGRGGAIAKTKDGGKTWTTYQGFSFSNYLNDITCTDNKTCYACGSIGKVIKSKDGGETWKEENLQLNNDLRKIYFLDNNFGFTAGQYGALARTIDGGENWKIINTGLRFPIIEIYFKNKDLGYIVSTSGEIGKTNDGGLTWKLINKDNHGVYHLNKVIFKDNTILGLQAGSIYKYILK